MILPTRIQRRAKTPKARVSKESKPSKPAKNPKEAPPREENHEEKRLENSPVSTPSTPSVPSPPSTSSDEEQEQARGRTEREIQAIQRIYRATGSMEKTADFFGVSVSTVHRYCSGIVVPPEVRDEAAQTSVNPEAETATDRLQENGDDYYGSPEPENIRPPRLDYEILAKRPRVSGLDGEPNGSPERAPPMKAVNITNRDDWDEIVSQVRAAAWAARYRGSAADFYSERIVPDLEIADLAKTYAGTSDPEVVKEVLATVWKKSLLMDRLQRDTGLAGVDGQRQKESLQS